MREVNFRDDGGEKVSSWPWSINLPIGPAGPDVWECRRVNGARKGCLRMASCHLRSNHEEGGEEEVLNTWPSILPGSLGKSRLLVSGSSFIKQEHRYFRGFLWGLNETEGIKESSQTLTRNEELSMKMEFCFLHWGSAHLFLTFFPPVFKIG